MLHEFRKISFASQIARCARLALALTATAWSAHAEAPSAPASPADSLQVETPDGYFSKKAIQDVVYETVAADTRAHLLSSRNAVWVFTDMSTLKGGRMYCFAMTGLTEAAPAGRSARIPSTKYFGSYRMEPSNTSDREREKECRSEAARTAIRKLADARLEFQLKDIDSTQGAGGFRPAKPPSTTTVSSSHSGVSDAGVQAIVNTIPNEFIEAFDYRLLQWMFVAQSFTFDNQVVCFGVVGVSAAAPSGRNIRFPGRWFSGVWEMNVEQSSQPDAEQRCNDERALELTKSYLEKSWDADGLLAYLDVTKEDGLPLVTAYQKPKAKAPPAPAPARAQQPQPSPIFASTTGGAGSCQPPAGKVLRYSDRCHNGNCTRTFENGCSVQFQAPYCYDALKGRWDWKPDGC